MTVKAGRTAPASDKPQLHSVVDVAREAGALRFPLPVEGEDARALALGWQQWATETFLRQANGYAHDGKFSIVLPDGTKLATRDVFSVAQEKWRVDASERTTLLRLINEDPVEIRPTFYMPPRPVEVPPALKLLSKEISVSVRWSWRRFSEAVGPASGAIEGFEETMRRQAQGWFVIEEVAQLLQDAGRGAAKAWREKFELAAQSEDLPMHEPESLERVVYKPTPRSPEPRRVRDFYDWAHIDDLNRWLDAHEPRLPFRFDSPTATKHEREEDARLVNLFDGNGVLEAFQMPAGAAQPVGPRSKFAASKPELAAAPSPEALDGASEARSTLDGPSDVALYANGIPWIDLDYAEGTGQSETTTGESKSRHQLLGVISQAAAKSTAPEQWVAVWPELVKMAQACDRPAPLLGYADAEGIKYEGYDKKGNALVKFLTRETFARNWRRNKGRG
jgi:hypothetical protein